MVRILQLCAGLSAPVNRRQYAVCGFGLTLFKYLTEVLVIYFLTGNIYRPEDFLNPTLTGRAAALQPGPAWLPWALVIWTLPFLWIALSMSVRRAADAGISPSLGLVVLVPLLNIVMMLVLCICPSAVRAPIVAARPRKSVSDLSTTALAIGLSQIMGGLMLCLSVYFLSSYGASLFIGTPLMMGATASYVYNRSESRGAGASAGVGCTAILFALVGMLLFALEGLFCLLMAVPLMLPLGAIGGLIGKAIADVTQRPHGGMVAAALCLPLVAGAESWLARPFESAVLSSVEIDAPPAAVWPHVISFPDLPAERPWFFAWGIACPERARIVGQGVGATRYCEFTTGAFVEPITAWEAPHRLAFDVTEQPEPMFELSPYENVDPPHLHGYLTSQRGEFRLVELEGGRTRLEGRTWYRLEMYPGAYWSLWTDAIISQIHERVLEHIQQLSERADLAAK